MLTVEVGIRGSVLDNAVWHSLQGPRRALGEVTAHAARFDPEVAVFSAVDEEAGHDSWDELRALVGPGRGTTLFRPGLAVPADWTVSFRFPGVQLVAEHVQPADDGRLVELGADDVPDMLALIAETKPGPFLPRTVELGGYIGLREQSGRLVAMAGERLRCPGFTEISAVCTLASHRGTGIGTALVLALVHRIRVRGDEAFLHAASDNENAIRLYLALGFTLRRDDIDAIIVRAPA